MRYARAERTCACVHACVHDPGLTALEQAPHGLRGSGSHPDRRGIRRAPAYQFGPGAGHRRSWPAHRPPALAQVQGVWLAAGIVRVRQEKGAGWDGGPGTKDHTHTMTHRMRAGGGAGGWEDGLDDAHMRARTRCTRARRLRLTWPPGPSASRERRPATVACTVRRHPHKLRSRVYTCKILMGGSRPEH